MYFTLRVCGLEANEEVVVRFDVQIYCYNPSSPTGNLQGQFIDAWCDDGTHLRGGKQTIPLKNVNRIAGAGGNCTPNDGTVPLTGPDFNATVTVYSPSMTNGVCFLHCFGSFHFHLVCFIFLLFSSSSYFYLLLLCVSFVLFVLSFILFILFCFLFFLTFISFLYVFSFSSSCFECSFSMLIVRVPW
jgi:hypothetical protein